MGGAVWTGGGLLPNVTMRRSSERYLGYWVGRTEIVLNSDKFAPKRALTELRQQARTGQKAGQKYRCVS